MRTIAKYKGNGALGYEYNVIYNLYVETTLGKLKMHREYGGKLIAPHNYDSMRAFFNDWEIIT